jgi:hypothetical protein
MSAQKYKPRIEKYTYKPHIQKYTYKPHIQKYTLFQVHKCNTYKRVRGWLTATGIPARRATPAKLRLGMPRRASPATLRHGSTTPPRAAE